MSDDYCGWPTDAGNACQNPPTGNDGRCWIDAHTDPGRPSKYNTDRAQDAIEAAREGKSKAGCARAAGVGKATLARWLDKDYDYDGDSFRNAFARARAQGESVVLRDGLYGKADPSMAKFLLSTSFGYIKTERQEHLVDGDADLDRSEGVTAEFVTYESSDE